MGKEEGWAKGREKTRDGGKGVVGGMTCVEEEKEESRRGRPKRRRAEEAIENKRAAD